MVAVATGISLEGDLRYRALIALSIPTVLVVSAFGASADAGPTALVDETDRAIPERKERQSA